MGQVTLSDILSLLLEKKREEAYHQLLDFLKENPANARARYMLGNMYHTQHLWREAIEAYSKAKMIDPAGPADAAIEAVYEMLRISEPDCF